MKKIQRIAVLMFVLFICLPGVLKAQLLDYGIALCGDTVNFYCVEIAETDITNEVQTSDGVTLTAARIEPTWETLWANTIEREIVMKINRRNIKLKKGDVLAVPYDMGGKTFMDFSPYPLQIDPQGVKLLIWDPALLAYGAYDVKGSLIRWGPGAGGKDFCADLGRSCRTRPGEFRIQRIENARFRSSRYPKGCSGTKCASMPFAMFFEDNYAFHAGNVPGANASHGCVRLFYSDAEWLSTNFVQIGINVLIMSYPETGT